MSRNRLDIEIFNPFLFRKIYIKYEKWKIKLKIDRPTNKNPATDSIDPTRRKRLLFFNLPTRFLQLLMTKLRILKKF